MNRQILVLTVIAAMVLIGLGIGYWAKLWPSTSETREVVILGTSPGEYATLVFIAEDQDYFSHNGLDATIRYYDAGPATIRGMETNEVTISLSAEYPIITEIFKRKPISIIGCVDKYETVYLVSLKESGITNISDLKGKKVGVGLKTQGEFFLGRFLELHRMNLLDVILVDIPYARSVDVLANGSVDACVVRKIDLPRVEDRLGSSGTVWPIQSDQASYVVMTSRNDWIASHPETIERLLRSLAQAERFAVEYPDETKVIVQQRTNLSNDYLDEIWPYHQFSLTLDQSLLIAMNDEGWWMIENNLTTERTIPDFRKYISTSGLKAVKPGAVTIP